MASPAGQFGDCLVDSFGPFRQERVIVVRQRGFERGRTYQVCCQHFPQPFPESRFHILQVVGGSSVRDPFITRGSEHNKISEQVRVAKSDTSIFDKIIAREEVMELLVVSVVEGVPGVNLLAGQKVDGPVESRTKIKILE